MTTTNQLIEEIVKRMIAETKNPASPVAEWDVEKTMLSIGILISIEDIAKLGEEKFGHVKWNETLYDAQELVVKPEYSKYFGELFAKEGFGIYKFTICGESWKQYKTLSVYLCSGVSQLKNTKSDVKKILRANRCCVHCKGPIGKICHKFDKKYVCEQCFNNLYKQTAL